MLVPVNLAGDLRYDKPVTRFLGSSYHSDSRWCLLGDEAQIQLRR